MSDFIKDIDERTKLAGANRLEVLLFSLGMDRTTGREEAFGINVFKVREVIRSPAITHAPDMPPAVEGLVSLRGNMVPVINVAKFCGMDVAEPPRILIVTEYNRQTQALLVHSVDHILRMEWRDMKVPPPMLAHRLGGLVTAVTELSDKRIVLILDVERVLAETAQLGNDIDELCEVESVESERTVLYADDSSMARKQIEATLKQLGVRYIGARNGLEAWNKLQEIAEKAASAHVPVFNILQLVLTDIEMPEMDGYVLTRHIKADPRFAGVPVLMHSSLSADANIALGRSVGADAYIPKFNPKELADAIRPMLMGKDSQKKGAS
jgi:two-component system chemotaxis response regulator CheV